MKTSKTCGQAMPSFCNCHDCANDNQPGSPKSSDEKKPLEKRMHKGLLQKIDEAPIGNGALILAHNDRPGVNTVCSALPSYHIHSEYLSGACWSCFLGLSTPFTLQ